MSPTFRALRIRNYRLFAAGQLVSLVGTWMQTVALGWLALRLTGDSGAALGAVAAAQALPVLVLGLWGGLVADRYAKRRVLVVAMAVEGVLAGVLAMLDAAGAVTYADVLVLSLLTGLTQVVEIPTRQSFVVEMVGPDEVANAVGINSATFNAARLVGPVVAGLMISAVGTAPVFLVNAVSFAAVIAGLLAMRPGELHHPPRAQRARGQLREGLRHVASRPDLLLPVALIGVVGTFGFNFVVTLPLLVKHTFHRDAAAYGVLTAALALGSLGGAVAAARRRGVPRQRLLLATAAAFSALELLGGLAPTYLTLLLLLVPTGAVVLTLATACNTTVQLRSDPRLRGRVMALYVLVFLGGTPVGGPLTGLAMQRWGARSGLLLDGGVCLVATLVVAALALRRRRLRLVPRLRPRPGLDARPRLAA